VADRNEGEASEAAARYARAVFDLGVEAKALDALEKDFNAFSDAWKASGDLRAAARSPLIEPDEKARALVAVGVELGMSEIGRNLLGVAATNRRAAELPGIISTFRKLLARHRGAKQVEIISARPLAAAEQTQILEALSKTLNTKVEAETSIDESLIGGFVVRVGSKQFDASIKSKLDALRLQLKSA
jgi:F-type H+-transporting ATPase subunit delta